MKKLCIFGLILLMLIGLALPCSAVGEQMTEPSSREIDVVIDTVYIPAEDAYVTALENGVYHVVTDEGVTITAKPEMLNAELVLVCYVMDEDDAEAYAWVTDKTASLGADRIPYHIYFADQNGKKVSGGKTEFSITIPENYDDPKIALLRADETLTAIAAKVENGSLTFTMEQNGYYVLAAAADDGTVTPPEDAHIDGIIIGALAGVVLLVVVGILLWWFVFRKKKEND